jgi:Flp pilus assembly protein TadD
VARAAVKAKQQAKRKNAPPARARARGRRKHAGGGNPNQQLFFMRMRRSAKPIYVLLAVLFAVTFAILGVGSGQNSGLDQIFNGLFGGGGSSISKAQNKVDKNPRDAAAYRNLATAYEEHGQNAGAEGALQTYLTLKKKDATAWSELGGLELSDAQQAANAYSSAVNEQQLAAPSASFVPSSGPFGTALSPSKDKIESLQAQSANSSTSVLYQEAASKFQDALTAYQNVAKLRPNDPNAQFQLATAAQDAGQNATAVAALTRYLTLYPTSPQRAQIEALIKQISGPPISSGKPKKKKK